jgi:GT2 family glycosyltransferase
MPSESEVPAPSVLVALLVYNGREFVPRTIQSAARLKGECKLDVLVLDDCSPEAGWSDELRELCTSSGVGYYRSPRNLGIPRNMNLGLLRCLSAGYDYVLILNSDTILPKSLVDVLVGVVEANENVGSVTAWSNSVSIYSLPNEDPDTLLSNQDVVDWLSDCLGGEFGPQGVVIPAAVGFCMLIPARVIREVGLFDPVFGRGYCEELDWCLRSQARGYKNLLAPNTFVYHMGSATTRTAGLLARGETTVAAHEKIIDWRYPLFRQQVAAFGSADIRDRMITAGCRRIVLSAAREIGYEISASSLNRSSGSPFVHFSLLPDASVPAVTGRYRGFVADFPLPPGDPIIKAFETLVGDPPRRIGIHDPGEAAARLRAEANERRLPLLDPPTYPGRI